MDHFHTLGGENRGLVPSHLEQPCQFPKLLYQGVAFPEHKSFRSQIEKAQLLED
jgi:hypothetical protein